MHRATRDKLVKLRRAVIDDRRALAAAREQLIEALGNWLCGAGAPPSPEETEALEALYAAHRATQARHAAYIASVAEEVIAQAQGRRAVDRRAK